jgi:hypothetical protein
MRNASHEPAYVWLVILLAAISAPLGSLLGGAFGDFMTLVGGCGTLGTAIAGQLGLYATRQARREHETLPRADRRPDDLQVYLTRGLVAGSSIGLVLWIADLFLTAG